MKTNEKAVKGHEWLSPEPRKRDTGTRTVEITIPEALYQKMQILKTIIEIQGGVPYSIPQIIEDKLHKVFESDKRINQAEKFFARIGSLNDQKV